MRPTRADAIEGKEIYKDRNLLHSKTPTKVHDYWNWFNIRTYIEDIRVDTNDDSPFETEDIHANARKKEWAKLKDNVSRGIYQHRHSYQNEAVHDNESIDANIAFGIQSWLEWCYPGMASK